MNMISKTSSMSLGVLLCSCAFFCSPVSAANSTKMLNGMVWPGASLGTTSAIIKNVDPKATTSIKLAKGEHLTSSEALASLRANSSDYFPFLSGGKVKVFYAEKGVASILKQVGKNEYARTDDNTVFIPAIEAPGVNGVARFTTNVTNVKIGPVKIDGAYRAVETDAGVRLANITIDGLTATNLQRDGIRFRTLKDSIIENFNLSHSATPSTGTDLPEGIALGGDGYSCSNVVVKNGLIEGFTWTGSGYNNGDGMATEGGCNGSISHVLSSNNTDGGFDLKGSWNLDALISSGNGRNYRLWDQIEAQTITSLNARGDNVWIGGTNPNIHIANLIVQSTTTAPILDVDVKGTATIKIDACNIHVPIGTPLIKHDGGTINIQWGAGCQPKTGKGGVLVTGIVP